MDASARLLAVLTRFLAAGECEKPGVVAVSGGADSVALLRGLLSVRGGNGLVMAHLNHALRGDESDGDEAFVRTLHAELAARHEGLSLHHARLDIAALARSQGESLETTARRYRYEWLTSVAREVGATWVATGHTADDQAETVLHRILRGTGLKGLCGIPARRELAPGLQVLRPLLGVRRRDVLAYLEALHQPYREDSSNQKRNFTRNRIRHELLPHLAEMYNPAIATALCRLAVQASESQKEVERRAAALLRVAELARAGSLMVFDADLLARESRHLAREMFRLVWTREGWPQGALGYDDWERLVALIDAGEGMAIDLADGVRARRRGRVIQLERMGEPGV